MSAFSYSNSQKDQKTDWFWSRSLKNARLAYDTIHNDCLVVAVAVLLLRQYLKGAQFKIRVNHDALHRIWNLETASGKLALWTLRLFDYELNLCTITGTHECAGKWSKERGRNWWIIQIVGEAFKAIASGASALCRTATILWNEPTKNQFLVKLSKDRVCLQLASTVRTPGCDYSSSGSGFQYCVGPIDRAIQKVAPRLLQVRLLHR